MAHCSIRMKVLELKFTESSSACVSQQDSTQHISMGIASCSYGTQLIYIMSEFQKAVILSDLTAAIQAIVKYNSPPNKQSQEIQNKIKTPLTLDKYIQLQWVPAHCSVQGNETADYLAKRGTKIQQVSQNEMPYQSAKILISRKIKEKVTKQNETASNNKSWSIPNNKNSVPDSPRQEAVAMFRIITGHHCLAAHLHRISIYSSSKCVLCNEEDTIMIADHLYTCPALTST